MQIVKIEAEFPHAQLAAARESITSLQRLRSLAPNGLPDHRIELLFGGLVSLHERGDLFRAEAVSLPAGGATILESLQLDPSDAYRELVSAIADEVDGYSIRVVHGWPVLACDAESVPEVAC